MKTILRWVLPLTVLSTLTFSSCVTAYRYGPPPPARHYHRPGYYGRALPPPPPPRGPYGY